MYKWYQNSELCYVFLPDVHPIDDSISNASGSTTQRVPAVKQKRRIGGLTREEGLRDTFEQLKASVWFTRVWTLQELLAPSNVHFFNSSFAYIGAKSQLTNLLEDITGIHEMFLGDLRLSYFPRSIRDADVA